eukprot:8597471-Pyramimonas_sp.AAC.1
MSAKTHVAHSRTAFCYASSGKGNSHADRFWSGWRGLARRNYCTGRTKDCTGRDRPFNCSPGAFQISAAPHRGAQKRTAICDLRM